MGNVKNSNQSIVASYNPCAIFINKIFCHGTSPTFFFPDSYFYRDYFVERSK